MRVADDVVGGFTGHERRGYTGFTIEHGAEVLELSNQLALFCLVAWVIAVAFECAYPPNVAHRGLNALDMELVFQADGKTVQRANGSLVICQVCIELPCIFDRSIEEDLVEAIDLCLGSATTEVQIKGRSPIDGPVQLGDKMPPLLQRLTNDLMRSAQQCPRLPSP